MHRIHCLCRVAICCLAVAKARASEIDSLFTLNRINPVTVLTALAPQSENNKTGKKIIFKTYSVKVEHFNQFGVSPSLLYRHHELKFIGEQNPGGFNAFTSLTLFRAYQPQDPADHLRLKNNKPLYRIEGQGLATGVQYSRGDQWWSIAMGFNQLRFRDFQTMDVVDGRDSLTVQYVLFDRSYAPYIASAFVGIDTGNGGITARLTPYIALQDELLVGPDFQFYREPHLHIYKIGTALAGITYKNYEAMLATGFEHDTIGKNGVYFSFGLKHRF